MVVSRRGASGRAPRFSSEPLPSSRIFVGDCVAAMAKLPAESIDLTHDEADLSRKLAAPLLVLWGKHGTIARCFSPLADWAERAETVQGRALDCGHYIPEEAPTELLGELAKFLS